MARVHLVTYATPRFRLRQKLLGWSARCNRIADTVEEWDPKRLDSTGFTRFAPDISLDERGSGFWAWKPFIIDRRLGEVPDGDVVVYSDVGRLYPFKLLEHGLDPFYEWMAERELPMMPGVRIPWDGNVGAWTKRLVLRETGMDRAEVHYECPVQASFSIWRAGCRSRQFVREWAGLCARRELVSDDPSGEGINELPGFRGHRHDQALLTLLCLRNGVPAADIGEVAPEFDTRSPSAVAAYLNGCSNRPPTRCGVALRAAAGVIAFAERSARRVVKFGKAVDE